MIKLYGFPRSRSDRVLWMLEELGIPYEFHKVDLMTGEGRQPSHLQRNPGGKVPVIDDDGFVLTESAAILAYLGEKFPEKGLVPVSDLQARARYLEWSLFVLTELEQPLWTIGKHTFVFPEQKRVPAILDVARWEFASALKVLDTKLGEREFALGDRFSAIDILIGHTLRWAHAFKVPNDIPRLQAYRERICGRPALARAVARESAA